MVILSLLHFTVFRRLLLLASLLVSLASRWLLLIIMALGVCVPEGCRLRGLLIIIFLRISHELAELLLEERVQGVED